MDYVVLHELTHFLYPKHNKDFYEFLTVHMPDWKERKRILDYEIVKGLKY
ncbi:MAG: M48 family metallopeptidase [Bacillota bacterium]